MGGVGALSEQATDNGPSRAKAYTGFSPERLEVIIQTMEVFGFDTYYNGDRRLGGFVDKNWLGMFFPRVLILIILQSALPRVLSRCSCHDND